MPVWTYVYHVCVFSAYSGQKEMLDPLKLELQMVVSCHGGAENQTCILCKQVLLTGKRLSESFYFT